MKHALLARIITYLNLKAAPYRYVDTHAGTGVYDLGTTEAERTGEWQEGLARLEAAKLLAAEQALFQPYFDCIANLRLHGPTLYPGSPEFVRFLSRPQDRLTLAELHPDDALLLQRQFLFDDRVRALHGDGWAALKASVPPAERRGLVLIDPPFEETDDLERCILALAGAHRKWSTGVFAIWYPIKDVARTARFQADIAKTGIPKILSLTLMVDDGSDARRLNGCGLVVVNPPWLLADEAKLMLDALARELGRDGRGRASAQWLAGETSR